PTTPSAITSSTSTASSSPGLLDPPRLRWRSRCASRCSTRQVIADYLELPRSSPSRLDTQFADAPIQRRQPHVQSPRCLLLVRRLAQDALDVLLLESPHCLGEII